MKTDNFERTFSDLGGKLQALRTKKGFLTSDAFSEKFDLPRAQYSRMESGDTNITVKSLLRILEIHGLSLEDFLCVDVRKAA